MAIKKVVISVFFIYFSIVLSSNAQSPFQDWLISKTENDTVYRTANSKDYFDYFKGTEDAFAVVDFSDEEYEQVLSVHKESKSGYLRIFFRDTIVFKYEIQDFDVQGIGTRFDYKNGNILMQGLFKDSALNGPLISYKPSQEIEFIADYKKGKFKKYLYHVEAKSKVKLKEMNRNAENPVKYKLITM